MLESLSPNVRFRVGEEYDYLAGNSTSLVTAFTWTLERCSQATLRCNAAPRT